MPASFLHSVVEQVVVPGPERTVFPVIGVGGNPYTAIEVTNLGDFALGGLWLSYQSVRDGETWEWMSAFALGGDVKNVEGSDIASLPSGETGLIVLDTHWHFALHFEAITVGTLTDLPKVETLIKMNVQGFEA